MKIHARQNGIILSALSLCVAVFIAGPGMAIEFCRMPNGGWGRGTLSGVGPGSAGVGTPPFGGSGWTEAGGWGVGEVIEVGSRVSPESIPGTPSNEGAVAQEGSGSRGGEAVQGIINLIPAIIGITGAGRGGRVSPGGTGSSVAPMSPSRSAPGSKCHTAPDGRLHCGSN